MEVLMHHMKVLATGDVDKILEDYNEDLIGISYEDDGVQLVIGSDDLRAQIEMVCGQTQGPPDVENSPLKTTCLQGIGDYAVIVLEADPILTFGAHTYISRNGKALYTTGFHLCPRPFAMGEMPPRVGELSDSGKHTHQLVEHFLKAVADKDSEAVKSMLAEDTVLIVNNAEKPFSGQTEVGGYWEKTLKEGYRLRDSVPFYIIDEAEGPLAFMVYQNNEGITAETYLFDNDRILFSSILHRDIL